MKRVGSLISAVMMLCLWSGPGFGEAYTIGPGDVLELRVLEWQPLENRVLEWESMRAEMAVDTDGMVSVPFLGQLEAQLLSPAQLSALIGKGLQQRFAVSASLDASVQVLKYRPVYISGAVRSPGEYPFRPGLTATQLVAQAARASGEITTRDILNRDGNISLLSLESKRLMIRRAMLLAAIEERDTVSLPTDSSGDVWNQAVVDGENEVLRLRKQRRARELVALDDQIQLLESEINSLNERAEAVDRILLSAQRDYDNIQSLAEGGLALGARVVETERNLMMTGSQLLEISTAVLQARQGISLAEAEKVALRDREWIEDTRELQRVEGELERVLTTLNTQQRILLVEGGLSLLDGAMDSGVAATQEVTILRQHRDGTTQLSGSETILAPGDVVHVEMPSAQAAQAARVTPAAQPSDDGGTLSQ